MEKGDKEKALADADECLRLRPNNPEATRYRAVLLADMDRLDEAVSSMEKLIEREPKDASRNVLTLAQIYVTKKQSAKALEIYDKYLAKEPENGEFLRGRGDAYLNLGKQAEAIADYEKAYKIMPKDSGLLNNFAWVLATSTDDKLRNGKRAVELAKQACELTEYKLPHILSTLAAAYAEIGDFENAKKWSAKAVEIGLKDQDDELKKELESYKQNKPWRESLERRTRKTKMRHGETGAVRWLVVNRLAPASTRGLCIISPRSLAHRANRRNLARRRGRRNRRRDRAACRRKDRRRSARAACRRGPWGW